MITQFKDVVDIDMENTFLSFIWRAPSISTDDSERESKANELLRFLSGNLHMIRYNAKYGSIDFIFKTLIDDITKIPNVREAAVANGTGHVFELSHNGIILWKRKPYNFEVESAHYFHNLGSLVVPTIGGSADEPKNHYTILSMYCNYTEILGKEIDTIASEYDHAAVYFKDHYQEKSEGKS